LGSNSASDFKDSISVRLLSMYDPHIIK